MVLSFALCATFAFAQTNRVAGSVKADDGRLQTRQNVMTVADNGAKADYKASIFTKDGNDTIFLCDFSMEETASNANYSFGVVSTGSNRHTQPYQGARWHRWGNAYDSTALWAEGMKTVYPEMGYVYGNTYFYYAAGNRLDSAYCSSDNGWAMIDLWSTTNGSGPINAYIELFNTNTDGEVVGIDVSGETKISVRLYQFLYKYADSEYIDYSTDGGTTWNSVQFNTTVQVNDAANGAVRVSLPTAAVASGNVLLRVRLISTYSRGYGYFWMLDDIAVVSDDADAISATDELWLEGAYGQIPQGMTLPLEWASEVSNVGYQDQTNVKIKLDNICQGNVTNIYTWNMGTLAVDADSLYDLTTTASLPTSNLGDNFVAATFSSDNIESYNAKFDTVLYQVNDIDENGNYTWARDNGVLNAVHTFLWGPDTSTYVDDDGDTRHYVTESSPYYLNSGYSVYVAYSTGATVPTDANGRPWVIRGVEYVTAVNDDYVNTNSSAEIAPSVIRDSNTSDGYVRFLTVPTGITSYTTNPDEDYNTVEMMKVDGYYTKEDGYNTIRIDFSTQTELMPNQLYHVGYELLADARFALAHTPYNTYTTWDEENGRFTYNPMRRNASMAKYANNFTYGYSRLASGDEVLVYAPVDGFAWAGRNVAYHPMIRLLVGPRSATNRISVTCAFEDDDEELGGVYSADLAGLCDRSIDVVEGANTRIYVIPENPDITEFVLTVDGTEYDMTNLPTEMVSSGQYLAYYYDFQNVTADHQVSCSFKLGVDDVAARVKMNLQPNPASSNVKLNIEGVAGYVNYALIDMSGRVVRSNRINAEVENNISLNGLAKGAYFVRITNNEFTKVERLIVR